VDAREIEVSVLGNERPEVSLPGEILIKKNEFYDYDAKYAEGGMDLVVPAEIPEETAAELRGIARAAYEAIDAAGMARVDFFLERDSGRLLLNEINTIPGFTPTSVYSRLRDAPCAPAQRSTVCLFAAYLRTTSVLAAMSPRRWFLPETRTVIKATR
jgi:D-alanine-D-alanine ligase